jgi:hypothetical protein
MPAGVDKILRPVVWVILFAFSVHTADRDSGRFQSSEIDALRGFAALNGLPGDNAEGPLPQNLELTGLLVRRTRTQAPIDLEHPVVVDGAVYQKLSAALRHHGRKEIVAIASCREDTDPAIDPSIERFKHVELDILEKSRLNHTTKKTQRRPG